MDAVKSHTAVGTGARSLDDVEGLNEGKGDLDLVEGTYEDEK